MQLQRSGGTVPDCSFSRSSGKNLPVLLLAGHFSSTFIAGVSMNRSVLFPGYVAAVLCTLFVTMRSLAEIFIDVVRWSQSTKMSWMYFPFSLGPPFVLMIATLTIRQKLRSAPIDTGSGVSEKELISGGLKLIGYVMLFRSIPWLSTTFDGVSRPLSSEQGLAWINWRICWNLSSCCSVGWRLCSLPSSSSLSRIARHRVLPAEMASAAEQRRPRLFCKRPEHLMANT